MAVLIVASSQPCVGRSLVAAALAYRLARDGKPVTLARLSGDESAEPDARSFASIDRVMLGTVASDAASPYFSNRERKCVITRYDKTDIQLAALFTDLACMVITGEGEPSPYLIDRVSGRREARAVWQSKAPANSTNMCDPRMYQRRSAETDLLAATNGNSTSRTTGTMRERVIGDSRNLRAKAIMKVIRYVASGMTQRNGTDARLSSTWFVAASIKADGTKAAASQ